MSTTTGGVANLTVRLWGDFNQLVGNGRIRRVPLATHSWLTDLGDALVVYDGEGNTCRGTVAEVTPWGCIAEVDLDTWATDEH